MLLPPSLSSGRWSDRCGARSYLDGSVLEGDLERRNDWKTPGPFSVVGDFDSVATYPLTSLGETGSKPSSAVPTESLFEVMISGFLRVKDRPTRSRSEGIARDS